MTPVLIADMLGLEGGDVKSAEIGDLVRRGAVHLSEPQGVAL
jgi:hypothetical protein